LKHCGWTTSPKAETRRMDPGLLGLGRMAFPSFG
jgi:hypothetical protein